MENSFLTLFHRLFDQRYSVIFQPEFSFTFIHQASRPRELNLGKLCSHSSIISRALKSEFFVLDLTGSAFFLRHPKSRQDVSLCQQPHLAHVTSESVVVFFQRCPLLVHQLISHHCSSSTVSAGSFGLIILVVSSGGPGIFCFVRRSVCPPEV